MTLFTKYGIDTSHCVDFNIPNASFASHDITLITDTFTSGTSLCAAMKRVKTRMNKYPSDVVVCVDRMESTECAALSAKREIENRFGTVIHPIVNADDILKAIENGVISAGEYHEKLEAYLERYRGE